MTRDNLQEISKQRRRESAALLRAGLYPGAYYLAGYSIECALKACVARQTKKYEFPDKRLANECWTHDLKKLVQLAGVWQDLERDMKTNSALQLNWTIVKDWSEDTRYDRTITRAQAKDLYSACTTRRNGILPWIRKRW
jgi:hypothetical protein